MTKRRSFTKLMFGIPLIGSSRSEWEKLTKEAEDILAKTTEYTNTSQIRDPTELSTHIDKHQNYRDWLNSYLTELQSPYFFWVRRTKQLRNETTILDRLKETRDSLDESLMVLKDLNTVTNLVYERLNRKLQIPSNRSSLDRDRVQEKTKSLILTSSVESGDDLQTIQLKEEYQSSSIDRLVRGVVDNLNSFIKFLHFKAPTDTESKVQIVSWYSAIEEDSNTTINVSNYDTSWRQIEEISSTGSGISLVENGVTLSQLNALLDPAFSIFEFLSSINSSDSEGPSLESIYSSVVNVNDLFDREDFEKYVEG